MLRRTARNVGSVFACITIAGCGSNESIDASLPDDAHVATHDDAPTPEIDTGVPPTADAFSSAMCFDLPEGQWTMNVDPAGTCPTFDGTRSHQLTIEDCNVTFASASPDKGVFELEGTARIDAMGGFEATSMTLNDTPVTCTATFSEMDLVQRLAIDCSGCTFTIRYGE